MIRKTFKMVLLGGAVLGGAGFLFLGTAFPSYLHSMASSVREKVVGQIPIELELKRAQSLIQQIDPQINSCQLDLARAEVELDDLQHSVVQLEKVCGSEEKRLRVGATLLGGDGRTETQLAADFGDKRRINTELARTKDSYVNNVAILKTKRALIDRQSQAVEAAKQRLAAVRNERAALEDQVQALRTQQMQIEALAASSKHFDLDSSALSQAKEVMATVKKRLDVAQRMLENEMVFQGEPLEVAVEARDMAKEIHELFAPPVAQRATAAVEIELPKSR